MPRRGGAACIYGRPGNVIPKDVRSVILGKTAHGA